MTSPIEIPVSKKFGPRVIIKLTVNPGPLASSVTLTDHNGETATYLVADAPSFARTLALKALAQRSNV